MAAAPLSNSVAWAYLRVSGDEQREKATIVGQRQEVIEYAHQHSLSLLPNHIFEDEAKPGDSTVRRDAFNRMIRLALTTSSPPDAILLWSWSRFARDEDDAHYFKAALRREGIEVISVTDDAPIEDKGLRYVMESLIHWKDAERRKEMGREIKRGLHTIARLGYAPGGFPPRGYKAETLEIELGSQKRKVRRWVPDPEYAPRVRKAWQMKARGHTDREIHRQTRIYKSMGCYPTMWVNRTYLGIRKCGDLEVPNAHEPLVDEETWQTIQLQRASGEDPRRKSSPHLLSGLLFCGYCKAPMNSGYDSHKGRKTAWRYYRCSNLENPTFRCHRAKKMSAQVLEDALISAIKQSISGDRLAEVAEEVSRLTIFPRDEIEKTIALYVGNLEKNITTGPIKARRDFLKDFVHRIEVYRAYGLVQYIIPLETGGTSNTPPGVLSVPPVLLEARFSLVTHRLRAPVGGRS